MNCPRCGNESLNVVYGFLTCWVECADPDCYWASEVTDKPVIEKAILEAVVKIYKEKTND